MTATLPQQATSFSANGHRPGPSAEIAGAMQEELSKRLDGEVRFDAVSRMLYSTDASNYQIEPVGVVVPRTIDDVLASIEVATRFGVPLLPRGGGSSLAGQTVGAALVMDFSKYVSRILDLGCGPGNSTELLAACWPDAQILGVDSSPEMVAKAQTAPINAQFVVGDFEDWDHPTPYQLGAARFRMFEKGSWGGEWRSEFAPQPGDVIAKEHYASSGFANTDLDFLLKQHRIRRVIVIGLLANTCIETTARFATELGYHTTIVTDATAAVSEACMHAAHELNGPTYAHAILTTAEVVAALAG